MNLNQAAHGDREHGFIHARLRLPRTVVVGHWSDGEVQDRVAAWMRVTRAWADWQKGKYVRFGDNMRQVAVTEGDKVAAERIYWDQASVLHQLDLLPPGLPVLGAEQALKARDHSAAPSNALMDAAPAPAATRL